MEPDSFVMATNASISRIRELLKVICCIRLMISDELVGVSSLAVGMICTEECVGHAGCLDQRKDRRVR